MMGQCTPEDLPSSEHLKSAGSVPPSPSSGSPTTRDPHPLPPILFQPKAGPPEQGDRGGGATQAEQLSNGAKERPCGVCKHLLLALVLVLLSPVIALGVCVADMVTGECCKTYDDEDDSEKD